MSTKINQATLAAGCYWGTERYFKKTFGDAITEGQVGFMGGEGKTNPGYDAVCTGTTGHAEVYTFKYDESKVSFVELLQLFFRFHNPSTLNYQQGDRGTQYRSAIFYHNEEQKSVADAYIAMINDGTAPENVMAGHKKAFKGEPVVTQVVPATTFFAAQEDHQQYLDRNPNGYCSHRLYYKLD